MKTTFSQYDLKLEGDDTGGLTPGPQHVLVTGREVWAGDLGGLLQEVWRRVLQLELIPLLETVLGDRVLPHQLYVRGYF